MMFSLDMPVHWNSKYLIPESLLSSREIFTVSIHSEIGSDSLTEDDLTIVQIFHTLLKVFYDNNIFFIYSLHAY